MVNLEIELINLFMTGESFSTNKFGHKFRDTTIIKCDGYIFTFKQHDISLKQSKFYNQTSIITTTVSISNVSKTEIEKVLEIIDNICWLLTFIQQSFVGRYSYRIENQKISSQSLGLPIAVGRKIIDKQGKSIRNFIEQVYSTFKAITKVRQLPVVFGYLCEANRPFQAIESSLILKYVIIENLKFTFSVQQGYKKDKNSDNFIHPNYPALNYLCTNKEEYCFKEKLGLWVHKKYGRCGSAEMTRRMFEYTGINRDQINHILKKRNSMIHEGLLLPFNHSNYDEQAQEDLNNVSDLIVKYLLLILDYKGKYYLTKDRFTASGTIK